MGKVVALVAFVVVALAAVAGCGGSSDTSPGNTDPENGELLGVPFEIHPRPPRSAIPIARAKLRKTLAEPTSPASPAAVIRRLELLIDVMYQAGRCGEYEETCNYERWEKLATRIWKQVVFWGFGEEVPGLRRTLIEEGFHNQGSKHGYRSVAARTWGQRLLVLEERRAADCKAIPTCPYEEREAAAANLRRQMGLPASPSG
jgi:hypothetical protein